MIATLLSLVLWLVILGVVLWGVRAIINLIPMDPLPRQIINIILIVIVVIVAVYVLITLLGIAAPGLHRLP